MKIILKKFDQWNCGYKTNLHFFLLKEESCDRFQICFLMFSSAPALTTKSAHLHLSSACSPAGCLFTIPSWIGQAGVRSLPLGHSGRSITGLGVFFFFFFSFCFYCQEVLVLKVCSIK